VNTTIRRAPTGVDPGKHGAHSRHGISRRRLIWLAIGVVGIVGLFVVRDITNTVDVPLPGQFQDFLTLSISVIIESLPFIILGILLSIVVQVWVPDHLLIRILPKNAVGRRIAISLLGVLLPVCECGNLPLARGLIVKGFTVAESMTFLLAAPIVNPITILTTYQAFGWENGILVARIIGGFLIANLIGWLYSRHPAQHSLLTDKFAAECALPDPHAHPKSKGTASVELFVRETGVILPALFIGSVIAGLVQVLVSRGALVTLGSNPVWSILAMMVLAFIISICSNVDAFFVLPFANVFLPGSIVVFLIFGPIIDIKMLAMMRTTFRTGVLVRITVLVALTSALIGLVVNYVA
jgi:uncharacterized membrane protein YraQ (UPF0718 family)